MANDTLELLSHVGWTGRREVHIVGISMGGMIAQQLVRSIGDHGYASEMFMLIDGKALLDPKRIASLSLVSTASGLVNNVV